MTRTLAALPGAARRLCLSRRNGEICTREDGHRGLHHRTGGRLLWSDLQADPPECPGAGSAGSPAATLDDGFPDGRAVCPVCWAFVEVTAGHHRPDAFRLYESLGYDANVAAYLRKKL